MSVRTTLPPTTRRLAAGPCGAAVGSHRCGAEQQTTPGEHCTPGVVLCQMAVVLPPAAPIFSAAEEEKAWAETCTCTPPSSPVPSTLTG